MKTRQMSLYVLVIIQLTIRLAMSQCPNDDFEPCTCDPNPFGRPYPGIYRVTCNGATFDDIKNAGFVKNSTDKKNPISVFVLVPSTDDLMVVPADLLGLRSVSSFMLKCATYDSYMNIDPNALRASKSSLGSVTIRNCDMRNLSWKFLTGFTKMDSLRFTYSSNFQITFNTLPLLPSLLSLDLTAVDITYRNGTPTFPKLSAGLLFVILDFDNVMFADAIVTAFVKWLVSTSSNTLIYSDVSRLGISSNAMKTIIPLYSNFKNLNYLSFKNTQMPTTISAGLKFTKKVSYVTLDSSNIVQIAPGAFSGNFTDAQVSLFNNVLTRFESGVFRTMLQQMASSYGFLETYGNPFDCETDPCHMAWLIRDNRDLLTPVASAQCSNGTWFTDLNPAAFKSCPK